MRRLPTKLLIAIAVIYMALAGQTVKANKLDINTGRFIQCTPDGSSCIAHNVAWERFMAEYAMGVSPKILAPASTLGYSGFYLGIETSIMTIPKNAQYLEGSNYDAQAYEDARWRIGTGPFDSKPPAMFFPSVHVRKGLPWSFEVGSSISYLAQSELVALGGEIKWALFEGYRHKFRGAMPDIAARGTVNRIIGQTDVDLTIVGVDGSISYPFGIGGMIALEPYFGFQYLWTIVRVEPVLYKTESTGTLHPSVGGSYDVPSAGLSGPNLSRGKIFFGLGFDYELLHIAFDFAWGLPKKWTTETYDDVNNTTSFDWQERDVEVDTQFVFSFGAGMKF
jgi:hypothetical protein